MQNFIFENPTRVIFGKGTISGIGAQAKCFGRRALLVYGKGSVKNSGIYDQVAASLLESDIEFIELPGVKSNPVLSLVVSGIEIARREAVELVLAVGGGSVIDTAKAIAAGVKADHDVWDFYTRTKIIKGALPVLTVLTISASASEMNPTSVLTNEQTAQKFSARSPFIQPKVSILDPTALFTVPPEYTAYSAVDTITHMLEGYFNNTEPFSPLQDRLVEGLIRTVMEATRAALDELADYNARANMMWASTLAFNGLTTAGVGTVSLPAHMLGHPLGALFDTPHGASLSIVLPAWMTYMYPRNPKKYAQLAREALGINNADDSRAAREGIETLKRWFLEIKTPVTFSESGIQISELSLMVEKALDLGRTWKLNDYSPEAIQEIYSLCR